MPCPTDTARVLTQALLLAAALAFHGAAPALVAAEEPAKTDESGAAEAEEEAEGDLDPFFTDFWKTFRPGFKPRTLDYDPMLFKPLASGSNNFFHHLLLLPPMEGRELLGVEQIRFSVGAGHSFCTDSEEKAGNRFKASFTETRVDLGYGISSLIEVRAGFNIASFTFDNLDDVKATQDGIEVFPPDRFNPSVGLGDVLLGLKMEAVYSEKYDIGISTVLTLKIPAGKSDFLTSGRGDFAMALVGTYKIALHGGILIFIHLNAGWAWFDEESVFKSKVYVNSASFYGLSIVAGPRRAECAEPGGFEWSVILQCQGHENAFSKLDQFNSTPVTVHAGLRGSFAGWIAEIGAGFGVTKQGSADYVIDAAVSRVF